MKREYFLLPPAGLRNTDNDITPLYPASYELENVVSVAARGPKRRARDVFKSTV